MRITVYLLREGLEPDKSLLRNSDRFSEVSVHALADPSASWMLFTQDGEAQSVSWLGSLRAITSRPDELRLFRRSAGAVLLVFVDTRTFAVTFGTGFHAIEDQHIEPDFGLMVAANSIDPDRMNLAEARGLGKGARNAVSSLPVPNRLFALRLATNEEWIRRIGGKSIDAKFAASASGADSLRLTLEEFNLQDLPGVLRRALAKFGSTSYRDHLPQLDNFRRLATRHPLVPLLDGKVTEELRTHQQDVGFAAPDEFHFYNVDYFELKRLRRRRKSLILPDLSTEGVYKSLDELDAWEDPLNLVTVRAFTEEPLGPPRALRQYVVADTFLDTEGQQERYVLTAGAWFSVAPTYAAHLQAVLARVSEIPGLGLPEWDDKWLRDNVPEGKYAEDRYNRHAATETGYRRVDRMLYRGPAGEHVEACDLLSKDKDLICVKRLDGSDTMIHLFTQGSVSATLLKNNDQYREFVLDRLVEAGGDREYGRETDWTVVFAIATKRPGPVKGLLPFFARASLAANLDAITDRGYKVAIAKIELV